MRLPMMKLVTFILTTHSFSRSTPKVKHKMKRNGGMFLMMRKLNRCKQIHIPHDLPFHILAPTTCLSQVVHPWPPPVIHHSSQLPAACRQSPIAASQPSKRLRV